MKKNYVIKCKYEITYVYLITLSFDKKFTNKFKNDFNKHKNNTRINFSNFVIFEINLHHLILSCLL